MMSFWTPTALDGGGGDKQFVVRSRQVLCAPSYSRDAHCLEVIDTQLQQMAAFYLIIWSGDLRGHRVEHSRRVSPVKVWTVVEGKLLRCRKLATSSFDHVVKLQLLDNALCFARFEAASCSTFGVIMVPNRLLRVAFSLASIALVPRRNSELTIASGNEPCMQVMTCVRAILTSLHICDPRR